jgi:hypothetical protein
MIYFHHSFLGTITFYSDDLVGFDIILSIGSSSPNKNLRISESLSPESLS